MNYILANYQECLKIFLVLMGSNVRRNMEASVPKGKRIVETRARSVPHRQVFVRAVMLSAIHYLGIFAAVTTLVVFFIQPTPLATKVFMLCIGFTGFTWLVSFFKRRQTHCPLCKGTPLINSGALAHQKATKIFPFNHGVSATLSIIATQKFRCMYCGTLFDMLKTPSHHLGSGDSKYQDYTAYSTYTSDEKNP